MGEGAQDRAERSVVVDEAEDQPGQTHGREDAVGGAEEAQPDAEAAFRGPAAGRTGRGRRRRRRSGRAMAGSIPNRRTYRASDRPHASWCLQQAWDHQRGVVRQCRQTRLHGLDLSLPARRTSGADGPGAVEPVGSRHHPQEQLGAQLLINPVVIKQAARPPQPRPRTGQSPSGTSPSRSGQHRRPHDQATQLSPVTAATSTGTPQHPTGQSAPALTASLGPLVTLLEATPRRPALVPLERWIF